MTHTIARIALISIGWLLIPQDGGRLSIIASYETKAECEAGHQAKLAQADRDMKTLVAAAKKPKPEFQPAVNRLKSARCFPSDINPELLK